MTVIRNSASRASFPILASGQHRFKGHVLSFDPGETTGWAWFADHQLIECGQFPSGSVPMAWTNICNLFARVKQIATLARKPIGEPVPDTSHGSVPSVAEYAHVVIEDYRIYSWKADDHKFSNVHTVKIVALCELAAHLQHCPVKLTLAHPAKKFCTDDKLQGWGYWQRGERHSRDAIRHACFYIMETPALP